MAIMDNEIEGMYCPEYMDNTELRELLEAWARQKLVTDQAQATLSNLEATIKDAYGDREKGIFSDSAHVARVKGRRRFDYEKAARDHKIPLDVYPMYSKMVTNYRKMCKAEGVDQEDIPFTRGEDTVKVSVI